jgi:hypothetical protein
MFAAVFAAFAATADAGDIKVLSDSPLQPALTKVADPFRQETHNSSDAGIRSLACCEEED